MSWWRCGGLRDVGCVADVLKQMILTLQPDMISLLVPFLCQWHSTFQDNTGQCLRPASLEASLIARSLSLWLGF